jgi:hypothetical protein
MPVPAAADHDRGAVMANEFGAPIGPGSKHRLEAAAIVISVGKYGLPVVFQYLAAIVEYLAIVLTTTGTCTLLFDLEFSVIESPKLL